MKNILEIVIDTREQTPWHFDPSVAKVEIGTLRIGDYAVRGDTGFSVERKSLDDFLGTIGSGWKRFKKEIERANKAGYTLPIIVEGRLADCFFTESETGRPIPPQHNHPKIHPAFIVKRIGELQHMGASVFFAENPYFAASIAYSMLNERRLIIQKQEVFNAVSETDTGKNSV